MTDLERTIRRELGRAGAQVHLQRRTARRVAAAARIEAFANAVEVVTGAEIRRRGEALGGDLQAARAAHQGAAAGEAVALAILGLGRQVSAGIDRLQAHLNRPGAPAEVERARQELRDAAAAAKAAWDRRGGVPVNPRFAARREAERNR
ncbi:hypothetical protein [Methylobacterium sp. C1]|uniref:hypothetical protein n=1 Tax=Methylobacterium sp. C1 TaxID=1479019 RepID=UPI0008DAB787|nr:hypothetical protein [Methylobacterium sp. C1]